MASAGRRTIVSNLEEARIVDRGSHERGLPIPAAIPAIPATTLDRKRASRPGAQQARSSACARGAASRGHALPRDLGRTGRGWLIGTSDACALRIKDPRAAPVHARLTYEGRQFWIRDVGSEHGVRQDGVRRDAFPLTAGVEIGIGATILVAESQHTIALRRVSVPGCSLGRDPAVIDHALRAIPPRDGAPERAGPARRRRPGSDRVCPASPHAGRRPTVHRVRSASPDCRRLGPRACETTTAVCSRSRRGRGLAVRPELAPAARFLGTARAAPRARAVGAADGVSRSRRSRRAARGPVPIDVPSLRERASELPRIVR